MKKLFSFFLLLTSLSSLYSQQSISLEYLITKGPLNPTWFTSSEVNIDKSEAISIWPINGLKLSEYKTVQISKIEGEWFISDVDVIEDVLFLADTIIVSINSNFLDSLSSFSKDFPRIKDLDALLAQRIYHSMQIARQRAISNNQSIVVSYEILKGSLSEISYLVDNMEKKLTILKGAFLLKIRY